MGLDNYWQLEDGKPANIDGEYNVSGGICSGHGNQSFRGKVYNSFVEKLTGVSLYSDVIDNDNVMKVADILRNIEYEQAKKYFEYPIDEKEYEDFVEMWIAHAMNGHRLVSWY